MATINRRVFLQTVSSVPFLNLAAHSVSAEENTCSNSGIGHRQCCGRPDAILIKGHLGTQMMRRALVASGQIPQGSAGDNNNGGPYWPKIDRMCEKLYKEGFAPTTHSPTSYRRLGNLIIKSVLQKQISQPLTIIGYSVGADAAIDVAHQLKNAAIRVDTLLLIETTLGMRRIPSNVSCCLNLYCPKPFTDWMVVARGTKVRAQSSSTELVNIDWSTDECFKCLREVQKRNHINIADCHELQDYIAKVAAKRLEHFAAEYNRR